MRVGASATAEGRSRRAVPTRENASKKRRARARHWSWSRSWSRDRWCRTVTSMRCREFGGTSVTPIAWFFGTVHGVGVSRRTARWRRRRVRGWRLGGVRIFSSKTTIAQRMPAMLHVREDRSQMCAETTMTPTLRECCCCARHRHRHTRARAQIECRVSPVADDSEIDKDEATSGILAWRGEMAAKARGRVLEIAGGTGRNLPYYTSSVDSLLITDYSECMLQQAATKVAMSEGKGAALDRSRVTLAVVDASALPLPSASFDTVVDTFGVCSFEKPTEALREMQRVCKPGGKARAARVGSKRDRLAPMPRAFAAAAVAESRARVSIGCADFASGARHERLVGAGVVAAAPLEPTRRQVGLLLEPGHLAPRARERAVRRGSQAAASWDDVHDRGQGVSRRRGRASRVAIRGFECMKCLPVRHVDACNFCNSRSAHTLGRLINSCLLSSASSLTRPRSLSASSDAAAAQRTSFLQGRPCHSAYGRHCHLRPTFRQPE